MREVVSQAFVATNAHTTGLDSGGVLMNQRGHHYLWQKTHHYGRNVTLFCAVLLLLRLSRHNVKRESLLFDIFLFGKERAVEGRRTFGVVPERFSVRLPDRFRENAFGDSEPPH